jgi:hypothetical protein
MRMHHEQNEARMKRVAVLWIWRMLRALFFFLLTSAAIAQLTTADIVGTSTDATGAVVPNASVTLTNLGTNEVRTTQTNGTGDYTFTLLQPGHYSVEVRAKGFKTTVAKDLAVEAGDRARSDAHLELGAETTSIEVEAQTPLLQADNATVSSTVTSESVQDLPLNGRNFVQLVQLVPGANEGPGNGISSGNRPDDRRQSAGFAVNGQDDLLNNFIIDGADDNERIIGTIGVRPSIESIQEITVETNSYAPEAGRTAGGVVNIVTKSGTNTLHGSVYEYFRNDILDARNFFSQAGVTPKAELRQNQFGASLGGPIWKNKTFYFGDYEGLRLVSGGTTYTSTVPTLAQFDEIHSLNGASPSQLLGQGNGTTGLPVDPVALNYLMLYPMPNVPGSQVTNNYITNPNKVQTSNVFDLRIDHQINANNLLFSRYTYNKVDTTTPAQLPVSSVTSGPLAGLIPGGGWYNFAGPATDIAQQFALNYTHIFTPHLVMELKAAYTYINNLSLPLNYGTNGDTTVGFGSNMNFNATSSYLSPINVGLFPGLGDGGYVPLQDVDNTYQYLGTVSWTKGNHVVKMGASLIRRQARNLQSPFAAGIYTFGLATDNCATTYTNGACPTTASVAQIQTNQLASTLAGAFIDPEREYDLDPPGYREWEPSTFAQDSWKIRPNLTLIYGLRYDVFTPYTEAHGHISDFDYTQAIANVNNPALVNAALKIPGVNGVSGTAGIQTVYTNVSPRIGFSATVHPGTVLRGGYGLSYYPGNLVSNADLKNVPFLSVYLPNCNSQLAYNIETSVGDPVSASNTCAPTGTGPNGVLTFDDGLPIPSTPNVSNLSALPGLSFTSENPKDRPAMIQQFNLQMEQQFGANVLTIGYVGSVGQHIPELIADVNVPPPNAATTPNPTLGGAPLQTGLPRPLASALPNLSSVSWLQSEGISNYNGLQTSFQRRFSKGLAFDANYTWSHALNDTLGFSEGGNEGYGEQDPTRIRQLEYGNADNDIRNRFALSLDYELPFGKQLTGLRKTALGGWQVNTIVAWQSGKPFTAVNGGTGIDGQYNNRALPFGNVAPGNDRPNQVHSAVLAHKTLTEYFDTTAFAPQTLGTVGDEARNQLYGPHFRHADLSIFKNFQVMQRMQLQFRAEAFNISNTPSFFIANNNSNSNSGNANLGSGTFGQLTQTDPNYVPRQYQFALKAQF